MKYLIILLCLILFSVTSLAEQTVSELSVEKARNYLHVREATNNNDAPEIDQWLRNCGLGSGYSYCQAFSYSMYKEAFYEKGLNNPFPNYAGVARFAEYCYKRPMQFKVISTKGIRWGLDSPRIGDIASWKHGSAFTGGFGYMGHAGLVTGIDEEQNIFTIEGNTKAGPGGDQSGTIKGDMKYGHEGVYERTRTIGLKSNFPIMYFIRLK